MTPVVIMAGGRGLRLHPLTEKTPKPMLKVGGKPILEQIIGKFRDQGFKRFWLCVNYRAETIVDYFGSGTRCGIKAKYIHETEPLGTAGAIKLLPAFDTPFIVCNADVLAKVRYGHLMEFHARSNADMTVCLALHQHQVPYGVADFVGESFVGLREKPIESFSVNAGIYVLNPDVPGRMPDGRLDMPDVMNRVDSLAAYPIEDFWLDVGRFEDLARANGEWAA